jgi:hypothetical protein
MGQCRRQAIRLLTTTRSAFSELKSNSAPLLMKASNHEHHPSTPGCRGPEIVHIQLQWHAGVLQRPRQPRS